MNTGYAWEGLSQVCVTLLGVCHVPECLCSGLVYLGRYNKCSRFAFCLNVMGLLGVVGL